MLRTLLVCGAFALLVFYGIVYALEKLFPTDMKGKAVLITGCDTGFGFNFVIRCAEQGMTVFAGCHLPQTPNALQDKCLNLPGQINAFLLDVGSDKSIDKAHKLVEDQLAVGQGLHAIVNNAAILKVGFDDWIDARDYEECCRINTFGSIRVTEKFKDLVKRAKGRIVLVSSIAGRIALPGFGPYNVSKYAVEGYADTIRLELYPYNVKVSIIEPGFHRTAATMPEYWIELFGKAWDGASRNVKYDYGGKVFLKRYNALLSQLLNSPLNSVHLDRVVDAYYDAISAHFPKERYLVGKTVKFFMIPLSMLPACVTDFILRVLLYLLNVATIEEMEAADTPAVFSPPRPGSPGSDLSNSRVSVFSSCSTAKQSPNSTATSTAKQ